MKNINKGILTKALQKCKKAIKASQMEVGM
jgi:hypothetical protein